MSEFWSGVLTGIGTSGVVASFVYWIQKRDGSRSESNIKNKVAGTTAIAREALRTTLAVQETTNEIHKAVRDAQLDAALNPTKETMRPSHQAAAQEFLGHVDVDGLKNLHAIIAGETFIYSGVIRDAEVLVSGNSSPALVPVQVSEIQRSLQQWLAQVNELLAKGKLNHQEGIKSITELHVELMRIHPFFDGNGLLGRAILFALCKHVLGATCMVPRDDPEYFTCLRFALSGQAEQLTEYLSQRIAA